MASCWEADLRRCRRWDGEQGFLTIQFVAAVGLSLVLFVAVANLMVWQYAKGVLRAAADEGARAGSRAAAAEAECEARAAAVVDDLLGGVMGRGVSIDCRELGDAVEAGVAARLEGWVPGVGTHDVRAVVRVVKERLP